MMPIDELWKCGDQATWRSALDRYWNGGFIREEQMPIEREMDRLEADAVRSLDQEGWYCFLKDKYFRWKYTAPNRLATTTKQLSRYQQEQTLGELFEIKESLFQFDRRDAECGLKIAKKIHGLGTAGASGLLAVLFPDEFGTVDQFVVKALRQVTVLGHARELQRMKPESLTIRDGVILIEIMRQKAEELNRQFNTNFWTPRKVDMILWTDGHN